MTIVKPQPYIADVLDQVIDLAGDYVNSGGLRVSVKTNLGPAIPVYSGQRQGGLAAMLGLKAGVIVTDRNGKEVARYGAPPPTEPIKVILVAVLVGLLGLALVRGVLPRR